MTVSITQATGAAHSRIYALGAARGDLDVPNDDLVEPIDSSDEWIRQRTGIISRKRASKDVGAADLAFAAADQAIERSGVPRDEIDGLVVATVSNPYPTPSMAAQLADRLGIAPAPAYDISAACAGYCYAVAQADALVRSGLAHYVVVVGAEKLSELVDPTDRSISFLLGDGAGAAVIGPSDFTGIGPAVWGSDGSHWSTIRMTNSLLDYRDAHGELPWPTLRQDGRTVFRWAVWEMAKVAHAALDAAGITAADLDVFIPHQANMRIVDELAKQLGLDDTVVIARDIAHTGNTSAASIPLATDALLESGAASTGDVALQIGFGAGLVYGAQVVVLP